MSPEGKVVDGCGYGSALWKSVFYHKSGIDFGILWDVISLRHEAKSFIVSIRSFHEASYNVPSGILTCRYKYEVTVNFEKLCRPKF